MWDPQDLSSPAWGCATALSGAVLAHATALSGAAHWDRGAAASAPAASAFGLTHLLAPSKHGAVAASRQGASQGREQRPGGIVLCLFPLPILTPRNGVEVATLRRREAPLQDYSGV